MNEAEAEEVAVVETDELEELLADARRWVDIHRLGDLRLCRHGILYIYIYYVYDIVFFGNIRSYSLIDYIVHYM